MDPRERLRIALLGAGCTRCGRAYPAEGIRVLAQREEIAFVQLDCARCGIQTLALVTGIPLDDDLESERDGFEPGRAETLTRGPRADAGAGGASLDESQAISNDDVDEMRAFLAGYQGDLRSLIDRRDDGGRAGRR